MRLTLLVTAIASLSLYGGSADASERSIDQLSTEVIEGLPIVAQFENALAARDEDWMKLLATEDFHVVDRADHDEKLSSDALLDFVDGCRPAGRMSSNGASITIAHECKNYEYRYVLYNIRDGAISRVLIGNTPGLTIERKD
ncbi:MAG: hypothetical protein WA936_09300 [Erythrobacter sp.]